MVGELPRFFGLKFEFCDAQGNMIAHCLGSRLANEPFDLSGSHLRNQALTGLFKIAVLAQNAPEEARRAADRHYKRHREADQLRQGYERYQPSGAGRALNGGAPYQGIVLTKGAEDQYMVRSALSRIAYVRVNDWTVGIEDLRDHLAQAAANTETSAISPNDRNCPLYEENVLFQNFPQLQPAPAAAAA